jgi:5-methylcytosine-specific restriction endonuclease McrA
MTWKKNVNKKNPVNIKTSRSTSPRKATIPVAFREQIWLRTCGKVYEAKCPTRWCQNRITVYDFQSGHNIPESKGGPTTPENLIPLCSRCNLSMGNRYTFDEWNKLSNVAPNEIIKKSWWMWCCSSN